MNELEKLAAIIKTLEVTNARLEEENRLLREKVDLLVKKIFGSKSEHLDSSQLELLLDPEAAKKPEPTAGNEELPAVEDIELKKTRKRSAKERKPRLPDHLPVQERVLDPEPVKANPAGYRHIGDEISEQLDYTPGQFTRIRTIRRKYVSKAFNEAAPIIAELPAGLQEGCLATPGLIAELLVNKYADHLPFYRQEKRIAQRHGVHIPRQSMINWEAMAANWLKPLYRLLRRELLTSGVLQADETCIKYIEAGKGKAQHGYLWSYRHRNGTLVFDWQTGRSHKCLEPILQADTEAKRLGLNDFAGVLQSDGYSAYQAYAGERPEIELAACWAHARRKFFEAKDQHPRLIGWLLRQIARLYQIEDHLRETCAGPNLRQALRASQSAMIYHRIGKALNKLQARILPQSGFGKAIAYTLKLWDRLGVYLRDGRVEIDNNLMENAIRPSAIGKKNWLFFGTPESGWKAAIIYTLLGNCKVQGIDPHAYLKEVLERLPRMMNSEVPCLLPKNWAKRQSESKKLAS